MVDKKILAIYVLHDNEGIVDDYVVYYLQKLLEVVGELLVVVNGKLLESEKEKLYNLGVTILERSNSGFDAEGYREGILHYGFETIIEYDSLVLCNDSVFGPFGGFRDIFQEMSVSQSDFWGITVHPRLNDFKHHRFIALTGFSDYYPEFIQTYFIVFEKKIISGSDFQKFWNGMRKITTSEDAQILFETSLTKYFSDLKYSWNTYCRNDALAVDEKNSFDYVTLIPKKLAEEYRYPFVRKKLFDMPFEHYLQYNGGESVVEIMDYIKNNTAYDVDLILKNILRKFNVVNIKKNLGFNYVLTSADNTYSWHNNNIALIMHLYYEDQFENNLIYAQNMPTVSDIYITVNSESKVQQVEAVVSSLGIENVRVILTQNRGREISALLIGCKEIFSRYDYVCFVHDKKSNHWSCATIGESYNNMIWSNLLYNEIYIKNVINLFENNTCLGIVTPPNPVHAGYYASVGDEWTSCFDVSVKLAQKLGLKVSLSDDAHPFCLGTVFWCRTAALKKLFDYEWMYEDFHAEPMPLDGTISHALERLLPFIAQDAGYYSGWIMHTDYANIEIKNLNNMLGKLNETYYKMRGNLPSFNAHLRDIECVHHTTRSRYADAVIDEVNGWILLGMIYEKVVKRLKLMISSRQLVRWQELVDGIKTVYYNRK